MTGEHFVFEMSTCRHCTTQHHSDERCSNPRWVQVSKVAEIFFQKSNKDVHFFSPQMRKMSWAFFVQKSSRDEHCFFRWATPIANEDFFPVEKGNCAVAFQRSKPVEHFLSDEQDRWAQIFKQARQLLLLKLLEHSCDATGAHSWAQMSKADEHFFSSEKKSWALFFSWASLVNHYFSDEQEEMSTFFQMRKDRRAFFF